MNTSDSERIAGFLSSKNIKEASKISQAGLVIFNTCGVRQSAEDRVYGQIHNLKEENPQAKIVLTGCLANRKDVQRRLKNKVDLFCEIKDFPKAILGILDTKYKIRDASKQGCGYLSIIPKYSNSHTAYVPIMTGCNNFCAYCVVPYARGRERSRTKKEIWKEIDNLIKEKYKEIILLGQNVNSYFSRNLGFPDLLDQIAKAYPAASFRFLTSHPKDFSQKLIRVIAKNKNISREIHLPIQSGSDRILRAMNRPYTRKYYLSIIEKIRKEIPDATFTTDVIVGFPGETQKDFNETVKIFKKAGYSEAYINKYSPRPGTAAWKLGNPIPLTEKKRREKILRKTVKNNGKIKK